MTFETFHNSFPAEVVTFISGRDVDFILKKEQRGLPQGQSDYLCSKLGFPVKGIVNIRQVHGHNIITATGQNIDEGASVVEVDGAVTNTPGVPLAVRTADCLPVFIYDPRQKCIGLVHAGWRGSQKGIVVNAVKRMSENWGCDPQDLCVAFGPGIRSCCYEVGPQLKNIFPQETISRNHAHYLDLALVNKNQLVVQGVEEENIYDCQICSCCEERFFSYRREGKNTGRHLSLMMLRK